MSDVSQESAPPLPKEDPETLVLRGSPRPVVRFRRGLIIGITGAVAACLVTLKRHDRRVSQRVIGRGIEIGPLTSTELHNMVTRRFQHVRQREDAVSPLSPAIHELLFKASCGQPRYMLNAADNLFMDIINETEEAMMTASSGAQEEQEHSRIRVLNDLLVDRVIPDVIAITTLRSSVVESLQNAGLSQDEVATLRNLGPSHADQSTSPASPSPAEPDQKSTFGRLEQMDLILRVEKNGVETFTLKGDAWLCNHFKDWEQVTAAAIH
jgi:predicted transcriptional regulator